MSRSEHRGEVRGARDLVALWRALPAAALSYPASALPPGLGLSALSGTLRAAAWRDHCAAATPASCAESLGICTLADSGQCRADVLFPMKLGGGIPSWRMATLSVQWRPTLQELRLIALGETGCGMLGWAARCLRDRHRIEGAEPIGAATLADLELRGGARWHLDFVTPWLVAKNAGGRPVDPDAAAVSHEIRKAMRTRAHKLTALCARESVWQRLGGHLAHHVADCLLPEGFFVEDAHVEARPLRLASRGNKSEFEAQQWSGCATLWLDETVLPWLSLVAICGGGENPDKGFGGIELTPLE